MFLHGLEAEATAVLGGGFRATATGAITKPKYLSYADATGDRRAERFNGVPEKQFSLQGAYERGRENAGQAKQDLAVGADRAQAEMQRLRGDSDAPLARETATSDTQTGPALR